MTGRGMEPKCLAVGRYHGTNSIEDNKTVLSLFGPVPQNWSQMLTHQGHRSTVRDQSLDAGLVSTYG